MADRITPFFQYTEEGEEKTANGEPYSVQDYIDWALALEDDSCLTEKQKAIIPALADYGHYAQPYLSRQNHWTIGTDFAEMTTFVKAFGSGDYADVTAADRKSVV